LLLSSLLSQKELGKSKPQSKTTFLNFMVGG
jgi:hypothetical protein